MVTYEGYCDQCQKRDVKPISKGKWSFKTNDEKHQLMWKIMSIEPRPSIPQAATADSRWGLW